MKFYLKSLFFSIMIFFFFGEKIILIHFGSYTFFYKQLIFGTSPQTLFSYLQKNVPKNCLVIVYFILKSYYQKKKKKNCSNCFAGVE